MADKRFVNDQPLSFDYDLDLGHGKLNFVYDTPSRFAVSVFEVKLNSFYWFLSYG